MLKFHNKIIAVSSIFACAIPCHALFASTKDARDFVDYNSDVRVAADLLVKEIRDDHNKNHDPVPGTKAYKNLAIVSVDPNFTGVIHLNDATNKVTRVEITNVSFVAVGVPFPFVDEYKATIKLLADLDENCTHIVDGTRVYTVEESNASLVDRLFRKDLTGRDYDDKYYAYADVVFESMFKTSAKLRALCPNFVAHEHKS